MDMALCKRLVHRHAQSSTMANYGNQFTTRCTAPSDNCTMFLSCSVVDLRNTALNTFWYLPWCRSSFASVLRNLPFTRICCAPTPILNTGKMLYVGRSTTFLHTWISPLIASLLWGCIGLQKTSPRFDNLTLFAALSITCRLSIVVLRPVPWFM
jgi:hypothetical protein